MASVSLAFKEVPSVNDVEYRQQFRDNQLRIEQLNEDVFNPTFYRNRNLLITALFILSMAVFVPTIRSLVLASPSSSFSVVRLTLGISSVLWGPFSYIFLYRNKSRDEKEIGDLTQRNVVLKKTIQLHIQKCQENMRCCDIAMRPDELPDGRLLNQRENPLYVVAHWTLTPWRALEDIADQGPLNPILQDIQDLDAQSAFLQSQLGAITQFRQANEVAKRSLETLDASLGQRFLDLAAFL